MTIILASKFRDGVAFAYDKNFVNKSGKTTRLEDKVYAIGQLAIGTAGVLDAEDQENFRNLSRTYDDSLKGVPPALLMNKLVRARVERRLALGSDYRVSIPEIHLFGFMEHDQPRLFYQNDLDEVLEPEELEHYGGIGSGFYPQVAEHLSKKYRPDGSLAAAIDLLSKGMNIAFEVNKSNPVEFRENRLAGQGFTIVTMNGASKYQPKVRSS